MPASSAAWTTRTAAASSSGRSWIESGMPPKPTAETAGAPGPRARCCTAGYVLLAGSSPASPHDVRDVSTCQRGRAAVSSHAMSDTAQLLRALVFSAQRHRDQRRKDREASPYINHPIEVAHLLASVGGVTDITVLVAAVLHDRIEDTET